MSRLSPRKLHSVPPPPPSIGESIAGKYLIEAILGEGGMGTVLRARHELLDAEVAVKLLSPDAVRDPKLLDRFLTEARAAAKLKSDHVARVTDVGTLDGGQPYIVMELLEGCDLEKLIEQGGKLPIGDAVDYVLQALEAMAHAHAAGIVHRDLKPANLFRVTTPDGREVVKVLDFGIAKLAGDSGGVGKRSGAVTAEHAALGSPSYMAPEQVRSARDVDHRADVWALGAILYELVTGQVAFGGNSVGEIYANVLDHTPPPMRSLRAEVPAGLERVVARSLERTVEGRYANVAAFARDLAPFGTGKWAALVGRIEQTLARAGKTSDPGSPSRPSPSPPPPSNSGVIPMPVAAAPKILEASVTAAPAVEAPRGVGRGVIAFAVVGVVLGLAGLVMILTLKP